MMGGKRADADRPGRAERERMRALEIEQLRSLIDDREADQALRDEARAALIALTACMEQEVTLEGVLAARGFLDAVATVHTGSVNVIVRQDAVTRAQSAIIMELALRETGQQSGNIKIIPVSQ